jgi:allantoicase
MVARLNAALTIYRDNGIARVESYGRMVKESCIAKDGTRLP